LETRQRLAHDDIRGIAQTPDGYLWVATPKGLARFDGDRFKLYDSSAIPVLKDQTITGVQSDTVGRLWLVTTGGTIVVGSGGKFTLLEYQRGQPVAGAHGVYADRNKQIFISSRQGEVFRAVGDQLAAWLPPQTGSQASFIGINVDLDGVVWARYGHELSWWDGVTWQALKGPDGHSDLPALKTGASQDGGMWISTSHELRRFRQGHWQGAARRYPQSVTSLQAILEDSQRNVWLTTARED